MKEIVVVSGKGGTGKTSFTASFAELAIGEVAIGDCDVDAANLALLLPGEDVLDKPFFGGLRAHVKADLCTGCGACYEVCRYDAIKPDSNNIAKVNIIACEGCRSCSVVCPAEAIEFNDNRAGTLFMRHTEQGPMYHGELGIAQDNSGKLVAEIRKLTKEIALKQNLNFTLFDGPPGIGCPVHAAIGGVNLMVIVTEPTFSGLHDLERLLDLSVHFKIKAVAIINKYDLDEETALKTEQLCNRYNCNVIGRVPFDKDIPKALSAGKSPLTVAAQTNLFKEIWKKIKLTLENS
jgi:MinD superfamily P-loop ATPase